MRCSRASTSRSSQRVFVPGIQVDQRIGWFVDGLSRVTSRGATRAPRSSPPIRARPARRHDVRRRSRPRRPRRCPSEPTQSGACGGALFVPEACRAGAVGVPVQVEWPPLQIRQRDGCDARGVARAVRVWSPVGRPGNSTLSRLVTFSRTAEHLPGSLLPERLQFVELAALGNGSGSSETFASVAGASECHTWSGSARTSSFVRPLSTERGWSSGSQPSTAYSSRLCSSIHASCRRCCPDGQARAGHAASPRAPRRAAHPPRRAACGSSVLTAPRCPCPRR